MVTKRKEANQHSSASVCIFMISTLISSNELARRHNCSSELNGSVSGSLLMLRQWEFPRAPIDRDS